MTHQGRWARALADGLAHAGVREVVVSPGSRSTPFVIAVASHPALRCHDVLDERSAAFFALGQARATGRASALLCTSGSAAAHYLPAVVEASRAFVPLLVLSADRPPELHGCGANQTVDQTRLFGVHARHFVDVPVADGSERALAALGRTVAQAVALTAAPEPGPVHLNLRARKPLEPAPDEPSVQAGARPRVHGGRTVPDPEAVEALVAFLRSTDRGVVAAGPAPLGQAAVRDELVALLRRTGWALCAEGTSQLRLTRAQEVHRCDAFDWIWRSETGRARWAPAAVLQLGAAPVSSGFDRMIAERAPERAVIAAHGWPDPWSSASRVVRADQAATLGAVRAALDETPPANGGWARELSEVDGRVWAALEGEATGDGLSEARVARETVRACDGRALLAVGNSLPVRELDAWVRGGEQEVPVASQRGASGIDGLVAGAAGLACATEHPTALLVGDLSFLHDLNGLAAARHAMAPLAVVVVQNGGGRIFEQLPIGARTDLAAHMPRFTTPHRASIAHAAAVYGHGHVRVETAGDLHRALASALEARGTTVVEAVVPSHGAVEAHRRGQDRVERALGEGGA